MNRGMKYLVFRYADTTVERLYLFPEVIMHKDFAAQITSKDWKVVRGGLILYVDGQVQCYGDAFSLGLSGDREKDRKLLLEQIGDGEE